MAVRGDAFADDLNAFNKTMNLGNRLAQGFTADFGSTQCRAITQCDCATTEGVQRYIDGGGAARCSALAQSVAHRVLGMIQPADAVERVQGIHTKQLDDLCLSGIWRVASQIGRFRRSLLKSPLPIRRPGV